MSEEKAVVANERETGAGTTSACNRLSLGVCLILGALLGLSAGGKVPDSPSLATLIVLVCGVISGIMVFASKGRKPVITLASIALTFLVLTVMISDTHWSKDGIWLFDTLALFFLGMGFLMTLRYRPRSAFWDR